MCKSRAQGGQRCFGHAAAHLRKAKTRHDEALAANDQPALQNSRADLNKAVADVATTAAGRAVLRKRLAELPGLTKVIDAGEKRQKASAAQYRIWKRTKTASVEVTSPEELTGALTDKTITAIVIDAPQDHPIAEIGPTTKHIHITGSTRVHRIAPGTVIESISGGHIDHVEGPQTVLRNVTGKTIIANATDAHIYASDQVEIINTNGAAITRIDANREPVNEGLLDTIIRLAQTAATTKPNITTELRNTRV